jgi:hypothetical protein
MARIVKKGKLALAGRDLADDPMCRLLFGHGRKSLRMHPLVLGGNCLGHRNLHQCQGRKSAAFAGLVLAARARQWLFFHGVARAIEALRREAT